jgi:hypothetical protein
MADPIERTPHPDLRHEALRVLHAARDEGLTLRAIGGLAVAIRCPSAARPPLRRDYKDLDVVGLSSERKRIDEVFTDLGYVPDEEFNILHGHQRLLHYDRANGRQLDTFLDRFHMCHTLELKDRIALDELTLPPADLLLSKLQVVETNERDLKDMVALLLDAEIDAERIARVCADDWGWWRTVTEVLEKAVAYAEQESVEPVAVRNRVETLRARIDETPKSLRWRARAKVGDRVRWYELPEENE